MYTEEDSSRVVRRERQSTVIISDFSAKYNASNESKEQNQNGSH